MAADLAGERSPVGEFDKAEPHLLIAGGRIAAANRCQSSRGCGLSAGFLAKVELTTVSISGARSATKSASGGGGSVTCIRMSRKKLPSECWNGGRPANIS